MRAQPKKKKSTSFGPTKSAEREQRSKASVWNLTFVLSSGDPVMDDASLRDPQKGRLGLLSECLEKALLLPEDMHELQSLWKRKVFLSLEKDLAKVCT